MNKPLDEFVCRQNVEHYRDLLKRTTDESQRKVLLELLAEQEARQRGEANRN